jgi:hypothetical protein
VLDRLEIVWSETDTAILARLYAVLLAAGLIVLVGARQNGVTTFLLALALAICVVDNAFTFRPHLYVGLCLALLPVLTSERPREHPLACTGVVVALALAKRDGLVLAPVATLLIAMPLRGITHNPKLVAATVATATVALGAGLSLTRIGGVSVGQQLLTSIGTIDLGNLLQREAVWYLGIVVALCIGAFLAVPRVDRGRLIPALALVFVTAALIIASAVLLEGAERFNDDTITRKLVYFLAPLVLTFLALATSRIGTRWLQGAVLASMGLAVGAVGYKLRNICDPRTTWGVHAIAAVSYFREAVPRQNASIGFYAPTQGDLARTPFSDVEAYQFPQMTAYPWPRPTFRQVGRRMGSIPIPFRFSPRYLLPNARHL